MENQNNQEKRVEKSEKTRRYGSRYEGVNVGFWTNRWVNIGILFHHGCFEVDYKLNERII